MGARRRDGSLAAKMEIPADYCFSMATIKVRLNGPYRVDGDDATVIDWNGKEYAVPSRPFALCRCGASANKPFCDKSHRTIGFQAGEAADASDTPT